MDRRSFAIGTPQGRSAALRLTSRAGSAKRPVWLCRPATAPADVGGWVLDIAALLAFADATMYADSVLATTQRCGRTLLVPLPVVASARARRSTDPLAGPRLARLLAHPSVLAADYPDRTDGAQPRFDTVVRRAGGDRIAALVAHLGASRGWPICTDRASALLRLHAGLLIVPV